MLVLQEVPRTKREYYMKELVVTEKNYIDALQMIKDVGGF